MLPGALVDRQQTQCNDLGPVAEIGTMSEHGLKCWHISLAQDSILVLQFELRYEYARTPEDHRSRAS